MRPGDAMGLLDADEWHSSSRCDGQEFSHCRPVVVPSETGGYTGRDRAVEIVVVYSTWCGDCGAADWETV